jgi:maltose-binding protein MalE
MEQVHTGIDTLPALPQYPALNEVFSRMTWAAVCGHKSVAQALDDAANECRSILQQ